MPTANFKWPDKI